MRTTDLTGALLDKWVCRIELDEFNGRTNDDALRAAVVAKIGSVPFSPSTNWAQGGPIIEHERIAIFPGTKGKWRAVHNFWDTSESRSDRPVPAWFDDPLIAAMCAYVASVYGDTVPDEVA
jgi:hypothetical protein